MFTKKNLSIQEEWVELKERVEQVLSKLRPALIADSGNVKLVDVSENGVVSVKLEGACSGCPFSQMTLKYSIEKKLKDEIPEVESVKVV